MKENWAEALARRFHETYERLTPQFGYETREASAKPWADVPEQNRSLMIAVCEEIISSAGPDNMALIRAALAYGKAQDDYRNPGIPVVFAHATRTRAHADLIKAIRTYREEQEKGNEDSSS